MTKLKLIKDRVTISEAITAMCDGLEKQGKRKHFQIDMDTFGQIDLDGDTDKIICCGCAATSAIQEISGLNFKRNDLHMNLVVERSKILGFNVKDLEDFESAIDNLRQGKISLLLQYYEIYKDREDCESLEQNLPILETHNWKQGLSSYRMLARVAKKIEEAEK